MGARSVEEGEIAPTRGVPQGRIESVPCSRVGHVFRDRNPVKFVNDDPSKTITRFRGAAAVRCLRPPWKQPLRPCLSRNLNRVAAVWMDEYAEIYHESVRHARLYGPSQSLTETGWDAFCSLAGGKDVDAGDISERVLLREKLQCRSFRWYGVGFPPREAQRGW